MVPVCVMRADLCTWFNHYEIITVLWGLEIDGLKFSFIFLLCCFCPISTVFSVSFSYLYSFIPSPKEDRSDRQAIPMMESGSPYFSQFPSLVFPALCVCCFCVAMCPHSIDVSFAFAGLSPRSTAQSALRQKAAEGIHVRGIRRNARARAA